MVGNTSLVDYGILNEQSDLRAHVCVLARRVYVYETRAGRALVASQPDKYRHVPVWTQGIKTATGYLVPPGDIPGCRSVEVPAAWLSHPMLKIDAADSTGVKGDRAALIVKGLVITNRLPMFAGKADLIEDHVLQVKGVDITVTINIQVKCDFRGGPKELGGTGNLFLQVSECNPFKQFGELSKKSTDVSGDERTTS